MKMKQIMAAVSAVIMISGMNMQSVTYAEPVTPENDIPAVTAKPEADDVFSITYDKSGGEGKVDDSVSAEAGKKVRISLWALKRDGYSHAGWTDGEKVYKRGETIEMPASDLHLTAVWVRLYELTYEDVSDLGYNWQISNGTVTPGTEIKLGNYAAFKGDAMFNGWLVNGEHYDAGSSFIMPEQDTYVAVDWLEPIKLIYFSGYVDSMISDQEIINNKFPGTNYDLPDSTKMSRMGYKLTGWYDIAADKSYALEQTYVIPSQDTVLQAIWTPITLAVRFSANGGTGIMDNLKIPCGTVMNIPTCSFEKEGYKLLGWKLRNDYYQPEEKMQIKIEKFGESPLFEAQWIEEGINPGDLNNDGVCDLCDLTELSIRLLEKDEFKDETLKNNADVLRDGIVNLADLAYLKQFVMKEKILLGMKGEVK